MYVERLHAVVLAIDVTTRVLETLEECSQHIADEVAHWPSTSDPTLTPATRLRLEAIAARAALRQPRGDEPQVM